MAERDRLLLLAKAKLKLRNQQKAAEPIDSGEKSVGAKALDVGLRALDFGGGLVRTSAAGLASIPQALLGAPTATRPGDVTRALKGEAPTSAEFLERSGVPEGGSVDILPEGLEIPGTGIDIGTGKTSARDIGGFALDVVTDPIALLTGGLGAATRPVKAVGKKIGEKVFRGSLGKIDEAVKIKSKGAGSFSKLAKDEGFKGNSSQLLEQNTKLQSRLTGKRQKLFNQAEELGIGVDVRKALEPARAEIATLRKSKLPSNRKKVAKMDEILDDIQASSRPVQGPFGTRGSRLSLEDATNAKIEFVDTLPATSFTEFGKLKGVDKKISKAVAKGFRDEVAAAGGKTGTKIGGQIDAINKKLQTSITANKPLQSAAKREGGLNIAKPIDSLLNALLGVGSRTRTGQVISRVAEAPGLDTVLRRGAIDIGRER